MPNVQCCSGSAPYVDRLCIGKQKHFLATSRSPSGHLLIPSFRPQLIQAGKRNGTAGLTLSSLWLSIIQIDNDIWFPIEALHLPRATEL